MLLHSPQICDRNVIFRRLCAKSITLNLSPITNVLQDEKEQSCMKLYINCHSWLMMFRCFVKTIKPHSAATHCWGVQMCKKDQKTTSALFHCPLHNVICVIYVHTQHLFNKYLLVAPLFLFFLILLIPNLRHSATFYFPHCFLSLITVYIFCGKRSFQICFWSTQVAFIASSWYY